jgi:hypothetical protein
LALIGNDAAQVQQVSRFALRRRLVRSLLFGIRRADPLILTTAAAAFIVAALIAGGLPPAVPLPSIRWPRSDTNNGTIASFRFPRKRVFA